jgi:hypothetical protein
MSSEQKENQLSSWFSNEHPAKWMVSTTALLHGVDYPQVNAVVFLGCPFGLYDFVQGAGRGGRAGQESLVAVLYSEIPDPLPKECRHGFREEMENVIVSSACRRLGISKVMDGKELPCSLVADALLCNACEGHLHPLVAKSTGRPSPPTTQPSPPAYNPLETPPSTPVEEDGTLPNSITHRPGMSRPLLTTSAVTLLNALTAQQKSNAREKHAWLAKEALEYFGGCFSCRIKSHDHSPCHPECAVSGTSVCSKKAHLPFKCTDFTYGTSWIDWKKRNFRWPTDVSRCHFCALPNSVAGFHSKQGGKGCKLGDSALTAAWHVYNTPHLFERLRNDLGFSPGNNPESEYGIWLTSYGEDTEDVRILSVFIWLCRQYYPKLQF